MRTILLRLGFTLLATSSLRCLDVEPLPFYPRDAGASDIGGGGGEDDASEDADPDAPDPKALCRACIQTPNSPGPGCGDQYQACFANEKCVLIFECVLAKGCTSRPTQPEIINCALPCVSEAGGVNIGDPAVQLILPIAPCVLGPCKPSCGVGP